MITCERCDGETVTKKDRFCRKCKNVVLDELKGAGFLESRHLTRSKLRTSEAKELTYETKHGTGQG